LASISLFTPLVAQTSYIERLTELGALRLAIIVAVAVLVLWLAYMVVEARVVKVERTDYSNAAIPTEFDGMKVLFVADIHAGPYMSRNRMNRLVERINAEEPDVVLLGGDYVGGRMKGAKIFYPAIAGVEAPEGVFAVMGNHDAWEGEEEAHTGMAEAGITLLENEAVRLERGGESIWIAGLEDAYTGSPDATAAAEPITVEDFAMLVSHNPDVFAEQLQPTKEYWDLAMAGHTHGGQVSLFGMISPFSPSKHGGRYLHGWKNEWDTDILISNGIGTVTAPIRLFTRPEMHVFTLRASSEAPSPTQ
jgi:predicted MPP superfamily phosphohydrolase